MEMFGLSIKTKDAGAWKIAKPYVKVGGSWVAARIAWVKAAGNWKQTYSYEWVYTFTSGEFTDVNIGALPNIDKYHNVRIIIPSGATLVASSTSAFALTTGSGYGGSLTIENNGKILGRGGNAGNGGHGYANNTGNGGNGGSGGTAISVQTGFTMDNNGTITGGGGGGGGGGGIHNHQGGFYSPDYSGGGGGGGGAPYGLGGSGGASSGPNGGAGSPANLTSSGTRGLATRHDHVRGGYGGNGGAWGTSGSNASAVWYSDYTSFGSAGSGGSAGASYFNPQNYPITLL